MKQSYIAEEDPDSMEVGEKEKPVLYGVEDTPAPHLCFLFALQVGCCFFFLSFFAIHAYAIDEFQHSNTWRLTIGEFQYIC